MEKNKFIYNHVYFDILFFSLLIIVASIPLALGGATGTGTITYYFANMQFVLLPIPISFFFYKVNKYYDNTFTIIRYDNKIEYRKNYFIECVKVVLLIVTLFYADILLCCFQMDISFIEYYIVIYILSIIIFLLFAQFNYFAYPKMLKKNRIYFYTILSSLIFNMLLQFIPPIYSDLAFMEAPFQLIKYIPIFLFINIFIFIISWQKEKLKKVSNIFLITGGIVILSILLNISYLGYPVNSLLEFPKMFFMSINEIILPLLLWILLISFLVGIMLYTIFKNYRSHFLFYAIRITNRSSWFIKNTLKAMIPLIFVLLIKYLVDFIYLKQNIPYSFIFSIIESVLWISDISLLLFLIYQFVKTVKIFNIALICLVGLTIGSLSIGIFENIILMRMHSIEMILSLFVIFMMMLGSNCYALNHLDYY